jgi:hypothetical protein
MRDWWQSQTSFEVIWPPSNTILPSTHCKSAYIHVHTMISTFLLAQP